MEGRDSRRRYRTAAEALEQLFAMPSDDESVDGMEDSDDDTSANNVNETAADDVSDSGETDDDDDILYQLADPNTDIDIDLSDEDFSDTDSESCSTATDDEETEWHKDAFVESDIDFDNIAVVPQEPFIDGDGPLEFFSKFFYTGRTSVVG